MSLNDDPSKKDFKDDEKKKLREIQLKRDRNNTFGAYYKDPCRKERDMSYQCIEMNRSDPNIDCKAYFDNFKKCKEYWNAVQEYRCRYMKKSRHDLPRDDEYEKWKKNYLNGFKQTK